MSEHHKDCPPGHFGPCPIINNIPEIPDVKCDGKNCLAFYDSGASAGCCVWCGRPRKPDDVKNRWVEKARSLVYSFPTLRFKEGDSDKEDTISFFVEQTVCLIAKALESQNTESQKALEEEIERLKKYAAYYDDVIYSGFNPVKELEKANQRIKELKSEVLAERKKVILEAVKMAKLRCPFGGVECAGCRACNIADEILALLPKEPQKCKHDAGDCWIGSKKISSSTSMNVFGWREEKLGQECPFCEKESEKK